MIHEEMTGISKFSLITFTKFNERVQEVFYTLPVRRLESSKRKYMYEAHQEVIMRLMEEAISGESMDRPVDESAYLILIGGEDQIEKSQIVDLLASDNTRALILYNVDPFTTDLIFSSREGYSIPHVTEVHWHNDLHPDLSALNRDNYPAQFVRVGLYGYAYILTSKFELSLNQNILEYLTIDSLGLTKKEIYSGISQYIFIPTNTNTSIKVIDYDRYYPGTLRYQVSLPSNIEWLTIRFKDSIRDQLSEYIDPDNETIHTIVAYSYLGGWIHLNWMGRMRWTLPPLKQLLELDITFSLLAIRVPLSKYPNLHVLKLRYDYPSDKRIEIKEAFSRLRHLRVLHISANRYIDYPDVFNRLPNVVDLKVNSGILPSMTNMKSLRYLTIHRPERIQLDKIDKFVEEKRLSLALTGTMTDNGTAVERDSLIEEMYTHIDSDVIIEGPTRLLANYEIVES